MKYGESVRVKDEFVRPVYSHEVLLGFNSDTLAEQFREWLYDGGLDAYAAWCKGRFADEDETQAYEVPL